MEGEVKEKPQLRKRVVSQTLKGIPRQVNEKIKEYQRDISAKRGKKFNLKTAYVEFLKEKTQSV